MGLYTISTETSTITVPAESADDAARQFAESEHLEFKTCLALKAYYESQGQYFKIYETDDSPTIW